MNPLPPNITLDEVLNHLTKTVPAWTFEAVDGIYIGKGSFFDDKNVEAAFIDGSIYVTSELEYAQDLYDNIVHELSHGLEQAYGNEIFGDGRIEKEFLDRRDKVYRLLTDYGLTGNFSYEKWQNVDYDQEFDEWLMNDLTYERLDTLAGHILSFPYALTDMHEYFATAFEIWIQNGPQRTQQFHPAVNEKLEELHASRRENNEY